MLRITAFGGLAVHRGDQRVFGAAAQPRRMALLAMVARAGRHGVSRDRLQAILWPEADGEPGRHALKQALYALRRDTSAAELFLGTRDLTLNPDAATADIIDFEELLGRDELEAAVAICHGPFLDGFRLSAVPEFEAWMAHERQRLERDLAEALGRLGRAAFERGETGAAVRWGRRLAALEPLNERLTLFLMEALLAAGDRAGALRQAQVYEALIAQELDLPAHESVLDLARRIRAGRVATAGPPIAAASGDPPGADLPSQGSAPEPARSRREQAEALYAEGIRAWSPQGAGLGQGVEQLRRAIALDPEHAAAHAALAEGYTQLAFYGFLPATRAAALADRAATEAIRLAPWRAEAHLARGTCLLWVQREFTAGIAALEQALAIDPTLVTAQARLAFVRLCHDGPIEAERAVARQAATMAGATGLSRVMFGQQLLAAGRYDEAIEALHAAIDIEAPSFLAYHWLAMAYVEKGMGAEAVAAAVAEASLSDRHPWSLMSLVTACAAAGQRRRAGTLLEALLDRATTGYVQASVLGLAHAALGELDTGIALLERAVDEHDPAMMMVRTFPMFAVFRAHPRFPALLRIAGWRDWDPSELPGDGVSGSHVSL